MPKFNVHLFTRVRVKVADVEANSPAEASRIAENGVGFHELLNDRGACYPVGHGEARLDGVEWAEEVLDAVLVDPVDQNGDVVEDGSCWLDADGEPLRDSAADAKRFHEELLERFDTLTDIVAHYGQRTLMDLFYLQAAILDSTFIQAWDDESRVVEAVRELPSAEHWMSFVKYADGRLHEEPALPVAEPADAEAQSPLRLELRLSVAYDQAGGCEGYKL